MQDLKPATLFQSQIGAEARIDLVEWQGNQAIKKIRVSKDYRNPDLDERLRTERTREEAQVIHLVKLSGVDTPEILFVDPLNSELTMSYVRGAHLKDVLHENSKTGRSWLEKLGRSVGSMHIRNIIHGDLTTKNILIVADRLVLIDFGLSFHSARVEDKAEDLHLLKQILRASGERADANSCFRCFLTGYKESVGKFNANKVTRQLEKIELRGRYARVD